MVSSAASTPAITIFPMCLGSGGLSDVENFLPWLDRFSENNNVKFTVTLSMDEGSATEGMKRYL